MTFNISAFNFLGSDFNAVNTSHAINLLESSYWFTNSCDFATVSFSVISLTKMLKMIIFTASGDAIQCLISIAAWLNAVWAFHWTLVKGKLWVIWYISFVKYSGWNDLKTDTENWSRERVNAHTRMQTSGIPVSCDNESLSGS